MPIPHFLTVLANSSCLNPLHRLGCQGAAKPVREEAGQVQQGPRRLRHHVRCWQLSELPDRPLAFPEDGHQEAERVHAREAPRCAGHGLGDVPQDCRPD